ncbi:phage major capsid protein [Aeromonas veronii]|uniref:phage major capsid protein n=1 Tax=Aeromonas veronii TaxID=654 RepID=UPI00226C9A9E|nr:phage major capsid protein [Aeromonas veronii]MCX9104007.1 phage major capsid protein [Aeromonas veronii]MCX9119658.1 phage major capsid protein [Aeromonas veronii]
MKKTAQERMAQRLKEIQSRGALYREATVASIDKEARTVELSFSSETESVERWFGIEILGHDAGECDLTRLNNKAPLLWMHDWDDQRGVIEQGTARIDQDKKGRCKVRFSRSEDGEQLFQDVADDIVTKVSVGYFVNGLRLVEERDGVDVFRVSWTPYEVSLVSVSADDDVGVGRSLEIPQEDGKRRIGETAITESGATAKDSTTEEVRKMEKTLRDGKGNLVRALVDAEGKILEVLEVLEEAGADVRAAQNNAAKAERERTASILQMGTQYDCRELAEKAVAAGDTVDAFRAAVLDHINTRGAKKPAGQPAQPSQRSGTPLSEMQSADIGLTDQEVRNYSIFRAVRALQPNATRADREAAAFELECSETAQRQLGKTAQGILIPQDVLNSRAFNAGGAANTPNGAQSGQNMVDTTFMGGSFIDMLRNRTTIMRLATTMGGLVGNVDVPRQTGGATAYWLGEGEDAQEGTPTIGQLELSPKTLGAFTDITRRLLMQSSMDAEGIVRRDLVNAMAQAIDFAGYYGSGAGNQPRGIKNYTGINAVDFAAAQPTFEELVAMESAIAADNADIGQMGYIGNATFRGHCKTKPKFGTGTESTIWEPGNTINGYNTEISNQIAAGDVFFGNFADMLIGMWGGLDLTVDPYSLSKSGGLRIVVFQDVDFVLRRVESFCWGSQNVA